MATATAARSKPVTARAQLSQMQTFRWEGTDKRGVKMKGETLAKNESLVKADLRKQGINPTRVAKKSKPLFGAAGSKITAREISVFSRQLATMMKAGVPLVQSFDIIAGGQKNVRFRDMLIAIKTDIEGGSALTEALSKHPVQFDELYRNLVKAGEGAGVLETVLDTVATYKERMESLKGKIKKALFYPAVVIAVAILVSAVLLVFVVPQFENVFQQFGAELPAFTQLIVNASRFMTAYWWLVLAIVLGTLFGFLTIYKRSEALQHGIDRLMLKLPVIGQILHNSAIARFARTLSITFKAGVPLVEALDIVAGATGSVVYEKATKRIRDDVSVGYQLNTAMRQVDLFPNMVVQMTAIGEEAGALDAMLLKVAEFYEEEVNNAVDALASLIEPFIMVFIGVVVGSMVVGMYLPIFKIAATI
ncbi:MAG TPA: type II secretion system F family protein [Xanthomonadales bacterium]|nr:type II secretion system F family protein [Xanthomonadales bacterium]